VTFKVNISGAPPAMYNAPFVVLIFPAARRQNNLCISTNGLNTRIERIAKPLKTNDAGVSDA
jgi:hypothetical protein